MCSLHSAKVCLVKGVNREWNPAPLQAHPGKSVQGKGCFSQIQPPGAGGIFLISAKVPYVAEVDLAVLLFLLAAYCFILHMATLLFSGEAPCPSGNSVNQKSASELPKSLELFPGSLGNMFTITLGWSLVCSQCLKGSSRVQDSRVRGIIIKAQSSTLMIASNSTGII